VKESLLTRKQKTIIMKMAVNVPRSAGTVPVNVFLLISRERRSVNNPISVVGFHYTFSSKVTENSQ
jgi:hypothetical protein